MKKLFALYMVAISFLLLGCDEKFPTYSSHAKEKNSTFSCLHYAVLNKQDREEIAQAFGIEEELNCTHRVELVKYKVGKCNNPAIKSLGGDFNGYVRVEVKEGFKTCYKVQSDYKTNMHAAFARVLEKIKSDVQAYK
jgi:hypothetical protein